MKDSSKKAQRKRIPNFKSEAEEAEFWDTHDSMDYLHDTEEANDIVFVRPEVPIIEVSRTLWRQLLAHSRKKRTTPDKLVNRWLREKLGVLLVASALAVRRRSRCIDSAAS